MGYGVKVPWKFRDTQTNEEYTFPVNPYELNPPFDEKQIDEHPVLDNRTTVEPRKPKEWNFTGHVYSQAQYDAIVDWWTRDTVIEVSDHLGRTFEVVPLSIDVTEKRSRKLEWYFVYTLGGMLLKDAA